MNSPSASLVYPTIYQIEAFAGCNLRCPLCHAGRGDIVRKARRLSNARFERIFDWIEPYAQVLYLHMWGEPTLDPGLLDKVRLVARRKPSCLTNVSTNGNGLSREYADDLVGAGLRQLIVSLDGWDQESYATYRVGGKFDEALAFLGYAAQAKARLGSDICIIAQCLNMAHTVPGRSRFEAVASLPGVHVVFKPLYVSGYRDTAAAFVSREVEVQHPGLASCNNLTDVLSVQADGDLVPCCLYPAPAAGCDLGNIFEAGSLEELLLRPARLAMREKLQQGIAPNPTCARLCGVRSPDQRKVP